MENIKNLQKAKIAFQTALGFDNNLIDAAINLAIIQNITIDQDCDFTETLTVKDSTGTVVDLSNETITSTMRKTC